MVFRNHLEVRSLNFVRDLPIGVIDHLSSFSLICE